MKLRVHCVIEDQVFTLTSVHYSNFLIPCGKGNQTTKWYEKIPSCKFLPFLIAEYLLQGLQWLLQHGFPLNNRPVQVINTNKPSCFFKFNSMTHLSTSRFIASPSLHWTTLQVSSGSTLSSSVRSNQRTLSRP